MSENVEDANEYSDLAERTSEIFEESNDQVLILSGIFNGRVVNEPTPLRIPELTGFNIKSFRSSGSHHLICSESGEVFSWGKGPSGELGHGKETEIGFPKRILFLKNAYKVETKIGVSCSIHENAVCHVWGKGIIYPKRVKFPSNLQLRDIVVSGNAHYIVLAGQGSLFYFHHPVSEAEEINPSMIMSSCTSIAANINTFLSVTDLGIHVWESSAAGKKSGSAELQPIKFEFPSAAPIKKVTMSMSMIVFLTVEGKVFYVSLDDPKVVGGPIGHSSRSPSVSEGSEDSVTSSSSSNLNISSYRLSIYEAKTNIRYPSEIQSIPSIRDIHASPSSQGACALSVDGDVYMWGSFSGWKAPANKPGIIRLKSYDMASIYCGPSYVIGIVGIKDNEDLKFNSFHPPSIKGGTIEKIVDWVTNEKYSVNNCTLTLLLTYDTVISSVQLFKILEKRCTSAKEENIQARQVIQLKVLAFIKKWIKERTEDFISSEHSVELLKSVNHFISNDVKLISPTQGKALSELLFSSAVSATSKSPATATAQLTPNSSSGKLKTSAGKEKDLREMTLLKLASNRSSSLSALQPFEEEKLSKEKEKEREKEREREKKNEANINVFDEKYSSKDIAEQMTSIEVELLKEVRTKELLNLNWTKGKAPNVSAISKRFNNVSQWIVTSILMTESAQKRKKIISKSLKIALHCMELNNFNTPLQIFAALNNTAVLRIRKHHSISFKKDKEDFLNKMENISNNNWKDYRAMIKGASGSCIPFLGLYLGDLTFIEEGNPRYLDREKRLINFNKLEMICSVIVRIKKIQKETLTLKEYPKLKAHLKSLKPVEDFDVLADLMSKKITQGSKERETNSPDISNQRFNTSKKISRGEGSFYLQKWIENTDNKLTVEGYVDVLNARAACMTNVGNVRRLKERRTNWLKWCEKLENRTEGEVRYLCGKEEMTETEVFVISDALEYSIQSFLQDPPNESDRELFLKILSNSIDLDKLGCQLSGLVSFLDAIVKSGPSDSVRKQLSHLIGRYKKTNYVDKFVHFLFGYNLEKNGKGKQLEAEVNDLLLYSDLLSKQDEKTSFFLNNLQKAKSEGVMLSDKLEMKDVGFLAPLIVNQMKGLDELVKSIDEKKNVCEEQKKLYMKESDLSGDDKEAEIRDLREQEEDLERRLRIVREKRRKLEDEVRMKETKILSKVDLLEDQISSYNNEIVSIKNYNNDLIQANNLLGKFSDQTQLPKKHEILTMASFLEAMQTRNGSAFLHYFELFFQKYWTIISDIYHKLSCTQEEQINIRLNLQRLFAQASRASDIVSSAFEKNLINFKDAPDALNQARNLVERIKVLEEKIFTEQVGIFGVSLAPVDAPFQ